MFFGMDCHVLASLQRWTPVTSLVKSPFTQRTDVLVPSTVAFNADGTHSAIYTKSMRISLNTIASPG